MTYSIEQLTPAQLARIFNHYADKPVAKFENREKGRRRLLALLAEKNVDPADAMAAVPPNADWTPPTEAETAKADQENDETFRQVAEDAARQVAASAPSIAEVAYNSGREAGYKQGHSDGYLAGYEAAIAEAETAAAVAKVRRPRHIATQRQTQGSARSLIIAACTQPEGATSAELFATTGWKFASWSHQLKLITAKTGAAHEIRKVDGTTRYFLTAAEGAAA